MYHISTKEMERMLQLDLSDAVPRIDIMYCSKCSVQLPCGRVGPTRCARCKSSMRYIQFSDQAEIKEWRAKQLEHRKV